MSPLLLTAQCLAILARGDLSASQQQVLWRLALALRGNAEVVSITKLAAEVRLSRLTTGQAIHALLRLGLLVRGARVGTSYQYKLNSAYIKAL